MSTRRPAGRGVVFDVPVLGGPHPPPTEQPCDPDDDVACAGPGRGYALQALHGQGAPAEGLGRERASARSPEEHLEQATHVRETLAAVAGLPPRERDALVWTSIQGRSGSDIARELGVSETAARQLVFRA